jgi:hypothetical protein
LRKEAAVNPHIEPDNNPTVAHEHTDADSHAITRFGIGLAFLIVVSQLLLWWMFDHFSERETKLSPHVPAMVRSQAPTLPPEPRLQGNAPLDVNPRLDLKQMRANEDAFLNHYGWIDPDHGIVHVPIDKALDVVAQTGLPKFKLMEPRQPAATRQANAPVGATHASPAATVPIAATQASPAAGVLVGGTHASTSPRGVK